MVQGLHSWAYTQRRLFIHTRTPVFSPWLGKIPWRRETLPTPVLWPGESHGLVRGVTKSQTGLSGVHFLSPHYAADCVLGAEAHLVGLVSKLYS